MIETITSLQNPKVKCWRALNKSRANRLESQMFLAEGEHMASEAFKENQAIALLVDHESQDKYQSLLNAATQLPIYILPTHIMESICDSKTPQGIAAVCQYPEQKATGDWLIALDGVQDPGNVGTIIRTMDAAGFTGLLFDSKTSDPYGPKALRATMGSLFRIPLSYCENLPDQLDVLKNQGYEIIAGDLRGEPFYQHRAVGQKLCIVIGNEGAGISPEVMQKATLRLRLPIVGGAESLNAAVAGAVMMYDFLRLKLSGNNDQA